jgi:hypothetical protein
VAQATAGVLETSLPSARPSEPGWPDGSCAGEQFELGIATNDWKFSTLISLKNVVKQPFRNLGPACTLALSDHLYVAGSGGDIVPVAATVLAKSPVVSLAPDERGYFELAATWPTGEVVGGQTPPPCNGAVQGVRQVEIPAAVDRIVIDLGTVWEEVCSSPASVTISVSH